VEALSIRRSAHVTADFSASPAFFSGAGEILVSVT
jgi:hypothetical protein